MPELLEIHTCDYDTRFVHRTYVCLQQNSEVAAPAAVVAWPRLLAKFRTSPFWIGGVAAGSARFEVHRRNQSTQSVGRALPGRKQMLLTGVPRVGDNS